MARLLNFCLKVFLFSIAWVISKVPLGALFVVAAFWGEVAWAVFRFRRFTVLKNVTIAFRDRSKEERMQLARESYRWTIFHFLEFMRVPFLRPEHMDKHLEILGLEHLEAVQQQGRGGFLLSLHLGNGDYATAALSIRGLKLHLISKKFNSSALNDFWFESRAKHGTRFLDPHNRRNAFDILRILAANEFVIFVMDQFMGKPYGTETRFFGRKTGTAKGLALFAQKTKAAVLPIYTYSIKPGRTRIQILPPIDWSAATSPDEMTQLFNDTIENIVRRHPAQWMWIHRRWKKFE